MGDSAQRRPGPLVKFGEGDRKGRPQSELWALRLQLLLIKTSYSADDGIGDGLETMSADSEDDVDSLPDDCDVNQRLTRKGAPDKRARVSLTSNATVPAKKQRTEEPAKTPAKTPAKAPAKTPAKAPGEIPLQKLYPVGRVQVGKLLVERLQGEEELNGTDVLALRRGEGDGKGGPEMMEQAVE